MQTVSVPIAELLPDPSNARKHNEKNLNAIKGSLKKFGQQKPIVCTKDNIVVAGNGALEAAKALGWEKINVVYTELKGSDATAYALADNRTTDLSEWDDEVLGKTLQALYEEDYAIADIGFDPGDFEFGSKEGLTPDDEVPDVPQNIHGVERGQIWLLGEHRLMCGDSTNQVDIDRLMHNQKADMVFTDPPYGISYQSNMRTKSRKFDALQNDDTLLTEWTGALPFISEGWIFVWTTWKVLADWIAITKPIGELTNVIVWDKGGGGIGDLAGTFSTDHEMALVFNRGAKITGKRLGSVWSIGKDRAGNYLHPTQKPVELGETAIVNCTTTKAKILDLFLGSGSTLIACEKTGRKCYGMEIDPHYCSVIIERWQKYTGQKAIKCDGEG